MTGRYSRLLKESKVLNQLCEIYYQSTGMVISIHYPEDSHLDFYPQEERSEFCRIVQSTPTGLEKCLACDRHACATARSKGGYYIYHCHAGLVDVVIPIIYHEEDVGSVYTGQVMLEKPQGRAPRLLFDRLALPDVSWDQFSRALDAVKVVEKSRLLFYTRLLDLMANYIVKAENEMRLQKAIIMKDRELHRREMEKARLEKTLRDLSIAVLGGGPGGAPARRTRSMETSSSRLVVEKACAFISANYANDITLDDVARAVFLSPNYFSSLFKKVAGCSFKSYLVRQRMLAAQRLLTETSIPIKEVVFQTGFRDYNYFNRTFHHVAGVTPAGYRARSAAQRRTAGLKIASPDPVLTP